MPYAKASRRQKDAARKRKARVRIDDGPGLSFTTWFRTCVHDMPRVREDDRAWSVRLAEAFSGGEEDDRTLRRYYDCETRRPRAGTAYAIGWAFHDVGLEWCSGPVALYIAGHPLPYFRLLALLANLGVMERAAALRFAFGTGRLDLLRHLPPKSGTRGLQNVRHIQRAQSRRLLAAAAAHRSAIDDAWSAAKRAKRLYESPADFRLAHEVMNSNGCTHRVKLAGALAILACSVLNSASDIERRIVSEAELLWSPGALASASVPHESLERMAEEL